ncbi:hypothetical protein F1559_004764 [Cyanidiococcus yangmingshanensis]|uniref:Transmembrane protein n=1 Tax=Cyanidiococcus yangmingshanensis TaxID=2690220 RepID=A0A7J7IR18_9RHOD|nr:hypothetical protein F1559_004764 [Cyanidiococcus yangmingshanensis]
MEGGSIGKAPLDEHSWGVLETDDSRLGQEAVFEPWQGRAVAETSCDASLDGDPAKVYEHSPERKLSEYGSEDLEFVYQGADVLDKGESGSTGATVPGQTRGRPRDSRWKARSRRRQGRYERLPAQPDGTVTPRRAEQMNAGCVGAPDAIEAEDSNREGINEIEALSDSAPTGPTRMIGHPSGEPLSLERTDSVDLEQGRAQEPVLFNAAVRPKRWSWKRLFRRLFEWRGPRHATGGAGTAPNQPYNTLQLEQELSDDDDDTGVGHEGTDGPEMLSAAIGDFLSAQHSWEIHAHRLVSQPDLSYAIAVNREALERKEHLRAEEQQQAAEQSRLRMAAMQVRSLFIRDASHDESMATGDPETFDLSVAELEMHERRVRAFRILLLFDAIFFVLLSITWLDALIAHEMGSVPNAIINGVVCVTNIIIDVVGLRAVSIQSARWLGVFIALYWVSLIGTIIAIPLLPLIPLLRFLLLPMAAAIKQFIEFQERQQEQLQHQAMIFV